MSDPRSQGTEPGLSLRFIDPTHNETKKMRAHKKSRGGCGACKKRKVKVRSLLVLYEPVRLLTIPSATSKHPARTASDGTKHANQPTNPPLLLKRTPHPHPPERHTSLGR